MITSTTVVGVIKQTWQPDPVSHAFELRVDEEKGTMAMELPTGTKIALDYNQVREMVMRIEARNQK